MQMKTYLLAKQKIRNLRRTIEGTLAGDFPFENARSALKQLLKELDLQDGMLEDANSINDVEGLRSRLQILQLTTSKFLPIIGFLLRSSNVRNAFELLDPLAHIARTVIPGKSEIILSSEWEHVPFARPLNLKSLQEYVFVGMPATEAGSALLLPITGHEIGHPVWWRLEIGNSLLNAVQADCSKYFDDKIQDYKLSDPLYDPSDIDRMQRLTESVSISVKTAMKLAEEFFCDLFAYGLFGESFLHAFAFMVAPGIPEYYFDTMHPKYHDRWAAMKLAADDDGIAIPDFAELGLAVQRFKGTSRNLFIRQAAEHSVQKAVISIWAIVKQILSDAAITRPDSHQIKLHLNEFENRLPTIDPNCLGDITNAGWQYHLKRLAQKNVTAKALEDSYDFLNELMLKSIEVYEVSRRLRLGS